jgi:hypothetical protein
MPKQEKLTHINPLSCATNFALTVGLVSLPALLIVKCLQWFDPSISADFSLAVWLGILGANMASAFIVGGFLSWAFNRVARITGGIRYASDDAQG